MMSQVVNSCWISGPVITAVRPISCWTFHLYVHNQLGSATPTDNHPLHTPLNSWHVFFLQISLGKLSYCSVSHDGTQTRKCEIIPILTPRSLFTEWSIRWLRFKSTNNVWIWTKRTKSLQNGEPVVCWLAFRRFILINKILRVQHLYGTLLKYNLVKYDIKLMQKLVSKWWPSERSANVCQFRRIQTSTAERFIEKK